MKVEKINKDKLLRNKLAHQTNPLHVYCRLCDNGVDKERAKRICVLYEKIGRGSLNSYGSFIWFLIKSSTSFYSSLSEKRENFRRRY